MFIMIDEKREREITSSGKRRALRYISAGSECEVYVLTDKTVVKVYHLEANRDASHERQKIAARKGFGPRTLGKVRYRGRPAYLSQRCKTGWIDADCVEWERLSCLMDEQGWPMWDLSIDGRNMGRLPDGTLVCIDFGNCSMDQGEWADSDDEDYCSSGSY